MSVREVRATGRDALMLATELLQRARRADPRTGVWEAADVQWWWRTPRRSDDVPKCFWVDARGPVAGVPLTSWRDDDWQGDAIVVPGMSSPEPEVVWAQALQELREHAVGRFSIPVADEDLAFRQFVEGAGLVAADRDSTAWLDADDRPAVQPPADAYALVDRTMRRDAPHPMRHRSGAAVDERLRQCPLYDPGLDLAVEAADGSVAGYSLYWFDPVTKVGLVEPVRVEDDHQRRGLASAMVREGIDRLAGKGATRMKVSYQTEAAGALYRSVGFRPTSTTTWYEGRTE